NAILLMMLLMGRLSGTFVVAIAVFVAIQFLFMVVLSLLFAKVPPQFHHQVVRLFRCSADTRSTAAWTRVQQLKMDFFISAFHTRNMYTFNYSRYGKCSYRSSGRVKI